MLTIKCDRCGCELHRPGALVFSPPTKGVVGKYHLCTACWDLLKPLVKGEASIAANWKHLADLEQKHGCDVRGG